MYTNPAYWVPRTGYHVLGTTYWVPSTGYHVLVHKQRAEVCWEQTSQSLVQPGRVVKWQVVKWQPPNQRATLCQNCSSATKSCVFFIHSAFNKTDTLIKIFASGLAGSSQSSAQVTAGSCRICARAFSYTTLPASFSVSSAARFFELLGALDPAAGNRHKPALQPRW